KLDVSTEAYVGRLEVIESPTGRKRRSAEERARIAAESLLPQVRVADVARRHAATRCQVYDWRRLRNGGLAVPESIATTRAFAALVVEEPPGRARQAHA